MPTARDEAILRHIGLYRITLRAVLSRVFFEDGNPANVIQRLRDSGLVEERSSHLPGRVSYYQLTRAAARHRVPLGRAASFEPRGLHEHLAILWFCCLGDAPRTRLEDQHLAAILGEAAPRTAQKPHCMEDRAGRRRILRVRIAGETASDLSVLHGLEKDIDAASQSHGKLAEWLETRAYGFAVLVDDEARVEKLRERIRKATILNRAHVGVHVAPSPSTLLKALDAIRQEPTA